MGQAQEIPIRSDLIIRTCGRQQQVHLKRSKRPQNVRQAFNPMLTQPLYGESILVVDDVCTTGPARIACAEALQRAGAGEIWALTVARARPLIKLEPDRDPHDRGWRPYPRI